MAHKWGIVVDLDRCTGCEACVVACHAENNLPTVGPVEAARQRAVHWIRVERYWEGEFPEVRVRFRPVMAGRYEIRSRAPAALVYANYFDAGESDLSQALAGTVRLNRAAAVGAAGAPQNHRLSAVPILLTLVLIAMVVGSGLLAGRALSWRRLGDV